jgi:FlaA1/EpsC-like NDP-sugar epimerase
MLEALSKLRPWCDRLLYLLMQVAPVKTVVKWIVFLSTANRRLLLLVLDVVLLFGAVCVALNLRFEGFLGPEKQRYYLFSLTYWVPIKLACLYLAGLYRPLIRYSGPEIFDLSLKGILLGDMVVVFANQLLHFAVLPRSVQIIASLISVLSISTSRFLLRRVILRVDLLTFRYKKQERLFPGRQQLPAAYRNVVIYGAGQAGLLLSDALDRDHLYKIIAFVDDKAELAGREIGGIPICHTSELTQLVEAQSVNLILLAIPSAQPAQRQRILTRLSELTVEVRTVPSLEEIIADGVSITKTREVDVADLLGREEVIPDPRLLAANIANKAVLVTGAGGSIGTELCRQIAHHQPTVLVLYEVNEFALYSIDLELRETCPNLVCVPYLGSITDAERLREAIQSHDVETIYHAAAYKHVPLVEANPAQGVTNNVYGTLCTAQVANACGVDTFVLISTDKAVRPTNVMGATKRTTELILQAMAVQSQTHTRFVMVRFGNVLGSSGSVVPRFRKQIADRKPITITHPEITRYFMSIPEAARLVIQAGAMGKGGDVFLLDMGDPVKIYDLATQMIELSGLQPGKDIPILITGLRPGEKLYEELLINADNAIKTAHPKIFAAHEVMIPWLELQALLEELFAVSQQNQPAVIKALLKRIVPEYQPALDRSPPSLVNQSANQSSGGAMVAPCDRTAEREAPLMTQIAVPQNY